MELIPVLDLLRGQAVHARAGQRKTYRPVQSALLPGRAGDAVALARAYHTMLGAWRCYVADLDAIEGWTPQYKVIRALADPEHGFGEGLLVDGGVATPRAAETLLAAGASAAEPAGDPVPGVSRDSSDGSAKENVSGMPLARTVSSPLPGTPQA